MTEIPQSHDEETQWLPSASRTELYWNCRGAKNLCKQVPPWEDVAGDPAVAGQRVHKALETGSADNLENYSEQDITQMISEKQQEIVKQWIKDESIEDARIVKEERIWFFMDGKPAFSAKLDVYVYSDAQKLALIIDAKSGRKAVTPPASNWQLRSSIAVLAKKLGLKGGRVAIAQPFAAHQSPCDYNHNAIYGEHGAIQMLSFLLKDINRPDAPRRAGIHCGECPARHICPEARAIVFQVASLDSAWRKFTPEQKRELYERAKLATKIAEQIEKNVRAEIEHDPMAIPGLMIAEPSHPRKITNPIGVFLEMLKVCTPKTSEPVSDDIALMIREQVQAAFCEMTEMSVGKLEEWYREKFGGTKKEATAWLNKTMAEFLTTTVKRGSIVKAPPKSLQ